MKRLQPSKEILISWRRCMEKGIRSNALSSSLNVKEELLRCKQQENNLLLAVFNDCINKVSNLMDGGYIFLLVDSGGVLLKKSRELQIKKKYKT